MRLALIVALKEIRDHRRDRRSLLSSASLALMGPIVGALVSASDRARIDASPSALLGMLSVFALVSTFAGGMNVAMDATAGERERRSLRPLLLNPVARWQIVCGKWMAVSAFALAALALNTGGLLAVLAHAAPSMLAARRVQLAMWAGAGLVPLVLLGAALNVLLGVMCRTVKEAQNALSFLTFAPMLLGMFVVFGPAWTKGWWFLLPIVGQQTLIGLPAAPVPFGHAVLLGLVTTIAALSVFAGATRVLSRDDVLA